MTAKQPKSGGGNGAADSSGSGNSAASDDTGDESAGSSSTADNEPDPTCRDVDGNVVPFDSETVEDRVVPAGAGDSARDSSSGDASSDDSSDDE